MDYGFKSRTQKIKTSRRKYRLRNFGIGRFLGHDTEALIIKEKLDKLAFNRIQFSLKDII